MRRDEAHSREMQHDGYLLPDYLTSSPSQGTNIAAGKALGIVATTGVNTEIGKIDHHQMMHDSSSIH